MYYYSRGKEVIELEINTLVNLDKEMDGSFDTIITKLSSVKGKIILMGVGKSGDVGRKISATMSSLGVPSYYLDPTEAMHGSLGQIEKRDALIMISNSGNTEELIKIIPNIKMIGCLFVAITQNRESKLYTYADVSYLLPKIIEADEFQLAPTSSTTATLALGDAIAIVLSENRGFRKEQFGFNHPGGTLGKKLITKVCDVMHSGDEIPLVYETTVLKDVIAEIGNKKMGATLVADSKNELIGIVTNGDLRRLMEKRVDIYSVCAADIMNRKPIVIRENELAVDVLVLMQQEGIRVNIVPVVKESKEIIGIVNVNDILKLGLIY